MAWVSQIFSVGEVLTAAKMNQLAANLDHARNFHKGPSAPLVLVAGVEWLDDTVAGAWVLKIYDGADWIPLFTINSTGNVATVAALGGNGAAFGEEGATNFAATGQEFSGPRFGRRNLLLNGAVDIFQRGTNFSAIADGAYFVDRWKVRKSTTAVVSMFRSISSPNAQTQYAIKATVTTADASLSAGEFFSVEQPIEGLTFRRALFGTAAARQLSLSFWCAVTAPGTYCVAIQNGDRSRSYVAEFTQVGTGYERQTIVIPGDAAGAWAVDNGAGARLVFCLGSGTTKQTAAGAWSAADKICTVGQQNFLATLSNDFILAQVQLEIGPRPTPFEDYPYGAELALCERYYRKTFEADVTPVQNVASRAGALFGMGLTTSGKTGVMWRGEMRATPTVVTYNPAAAAASWYNATDVAPGSAGTQEFISARGVYLTNGAGSAGESGDMLFIHASADAEIT